MEALDVFGGCYGLIGTEELTSTDTPASGELKGQTEGLPRTWWLIPSSLHRVAYTE